MKHGIALALALACGYPALPACAAVTIDLSGEYSPGSTVALSLTTSQFLADKTGSFAATITVNSLLKTITAKGIGGSANAEPRRTTITIRDNATKAVSAITVNVSCLNSSPSYVCGQTKNVTAPQLRVNTAGDGKVTYAIYTYSADIDDLVFERSITLAAPLSLTSANDAEGTQYRYYNGPLSSFYFIKPPGVIDLQAPEAGAFHFSLIGGLDATTGIDQFTTAIAAVDNEIYNFSARIRITGAPDVTPLPGGGSVPEPATWSLLIAGFGMVGAALRRRAAQPRIRPSAA